MWDTASPRSAKQGLQGQKFPSITFPTSHTKEAFPALEGGKNQSRTSLPLSHLPDDQDNLCPSHGTDASSCPQLIEFSSCAKLLFLGTQAAKPCPAGTWEQRPQHPPATTAPSFRSQNSWRWQQRNNNSSPAPKISLRASMLPGKLQRGTASHLPSV